MCTPTPPPAPDSGLTVARLHAVLHRAMVAGQGSQAILLGGMDAPLVRAAYVEEVVGDGYVIR